LRQAALRRISRPDSYGCLERWKADVQERVAERTADHEQSRTALQKLNEELELRIEQRDDPADLDDPEPDG